MFPLFDRLRDVNSVIHKLELENKRSARDWEEKTFLAARIDFLYGIILLAVLCVPGVSCFFLTALAPIFMPLLPFTIMFSGFVIASGLLQTYYNRQLKKAAIVLSRDRVIEYGAFQRVRIFTYEQIYAVEKDLRSGVFVQYYPYDRNGKINTNVIRKGALLKTTKDSLLLQLLQERIEGLQPRPEVASRFFYHKYTLPLLFFIIGGLLVTLPLIVAFALPSGRSGLLVMGLSMILWILILGGFAVRNRLEAHRSGLAVENKKKHKRP